ncbi:MAG: TPM domain-containing protein [Clostridia bacterium]|nr:TPM domain-containing protein [Clostridia bacterium]
MKKRILSLFLALLITLSCVIFVGAADFPSFVVDYTETLSQDEIYALNELSNGYYKKYNTEISYALFEGNDSEEIVSQAEDLEPATDAESRILLAVNDDYWYVVSSGTIGDSIDDDVEETFFDFSVGDDRYDGIQSYIIKAGNYVSDFFDEPETETTKAEKTTAVSSADSSLKNLPKPSNNINFTGKYPHIMDTAKLLSKEDVASLEEKLSKISEQQKLELVVVTTQNSEGFEVSDYAERIFTTCDYGYGEAKDGILLLLSMKERDWYIATHGYGKTVLPDWQVESVGEKIVPDLSAGNYADAFSSFADECNDYIETKKNGDVDFDSDGNYSRAPLPIIVLPICFGIGLIIALIVVGIMRRKLKTAVRQKEANNYVKDGSFRVTESYDQFLYSNVTQTKISRDNNDSSVSGGGGGGNSSSDSSFGGGGGKF